MDAVRPLAGIRVVDFCWVLAGPLGTRILANFGADVIRIPPSPDRALNDFFPPGHRAPELGAFHNLVDTGKRSWAVDPRAEEGKEQILRLIDTADVVTENYRPGALGRMGFGYDVLRQRNPGIVVLHMPGCGSRGPWAARPTLGNMVVGASGISHLTGFPGRPPRGMGVAYPDFTSPYLLVTTVLAALHRRGQTGVGQEIDLNQLSATISLIGVEWMQFMASGEPPPIKANRDPNYCPHGIYPAAGDDEWVALAVEGDDEWRSFCDLTGIGASAFPTHGARKAAEDAVDDRVKTWTATVGKWDAAHSLQAAGIAAAPVVGLADALDRDPHLARHYQRIRREPAPDVDIVVQGEAIRVAGVARPIVPAPRPGADGDDIVASMLRSAGGEE